jgi:uncharacterized FlgJ-related protein
MKKLILLLVMIIGVVSCTAPSLLPKNYENNRLSYAKSKVRIEIYKYTYSDFSVENLQDYLKIRGVKNANKIIAQAVLETAWFNSSSFKDANNLFGMKLPKCRKTTAIGSYLGHAKYNHWTDSVEDYLLWIEYWEKFGYEYNDHYDFLNEIGYATDPLYNNKLKWIERRLV